MATSLVLSPSTTFGMGLEDRVFDIIADETQWPKEDVLDADHFAELGIDDFLSESIISRIKTNLHLDITGAFKRTASVSDFQTYLRDVSESGRRSRPLVKARAETRPSVKRIATAPATTTSSPTTASPAKKPLTTSTPARNSKAHSTNSSPTRNRIRPRPTSPALSIVLQGNPTTCKRTVFLFPDGSGSGMSYCRFPSLSEDTCLIGLNSPHLTTASASTATTTGVEDLAATWVREIRSRQPHGPYIVGGWSAGGFYTFEAAKQLMREGEVVSKIILIDSPCRLRFDALPTDVIDYLAKNKLFGAGNKQPTKTPDWLVKHFEFTVAAVDQYMPTPITTSEFQMQLPEVFILWSEDGLLSTQPGGVEKMADAGIDVDFNVTRFLIDQKPNYGPNGWDNLFPPSTKIHFAKSSGNHFTMVQAPHCHKLVERLRDAVVRDNHVKVKGGWN